MRDGYPAWFYDSTAYGDPALARLRLGRVAGANSVLLTGSVDLDIKGKVAESGQNVITALDGHGRIVGSYAKAHLVPYGEYLPMRGLLEPLGLARLVPGEIDFRAGPGPRTVDLADLGKAGMQICYEIIFSGQVVDREHRPDYIVNPSNDGWFGDWGPPQHLAQARLRAIEEGLPVLRSTTNGVSAVVDADGIIRHAAPRGGGTFRRFRAARACRDAVRADGQHTSACLGCASSWRQRPCVAAKGGVGREHKASFISQDGYAQRLPLHFRKRLRRASRQGCRPDQRCHRRPVPLERPRGAHRLRNADHHPAGGAGGRNPLQGRL
jgi:predicted amidohydrolase